MRILRLTVSLLFIAVLCLYIVFNVRDARRDKTYPVISFESEQITVPLDATADDMLAGVSAFDEKDGDLSDKVIVESFRDEPVNVNVVVGTKRIPVTLKPHSYELISIK